MYTGSPSEKRRAAVFFLLPSSAALLLFFLIPIVSSAVISVLVYDPLKPISAIQFVGVENFTRLFETREIPAQYSHVFYYMVLYIPLILSTSMIEALVLNRDFAGKKLYKILFYLPVISSWVAVALIWKWLLNGKYGLINNWLMACGIAGPSWMTSQVWAMPGVVLAAVWKDTGYYALILLAALKGINKTYYDAALIDGATSWQRFRRITMPLLSPTLFLLVVINVINGFQVFESIYIMTEGGPAGATRVPVEQIYRYAFTYYRMGYASAIAWVLAAVIFVATFIQFSLQKRWVTYES